MKINSINQQNNQNFKGVAKWIAKTPKIATGVATLAASSAIAQKIVMSGSEAAIGPVMDIGIGKAITKATGETDGRTNESSKVQAIRTFAQSVGGTIVGVVIRLLCIGGLTLAFSKLGGKASGKIAEIINKNKLAEGSYDYVKNAEAWGRNAGGYLATLVMLVTNFIIDAPFINLINKKTSEVVDNISNKKNQEKEVK